MRECSTGSRSPDDLTGAGCAADGIYCRGLILHHLIKNRFRRSASSIFVLQKFNAFQLVISNSDLNPYPDNASVALTFIYAVFYLCQVDFIKGESGHLRFIVTDEFEVESAREKANDQKCRYNNQNCFISLSRNCSSLYHCTTSARFSELT